MQIDIANIINKTECIYNEDFEIGFTHVNFSSNKYKVDSFSGFNILIKNVGAKKISIHLEGSIILQISCSRCLSKVLYPINFMIDNILTIDENGKGYDEDEDEHGYIHEFLLDTDELILDELYMQIPASVLCKEECKGLCPSCGINLNTSTCNCNTESLDPRMARIRDIYNNFKEV